MRYSRLVSQSLSRRHFHTNRFPQPTTLINSCPYKTKTPNFINPGIGYSSNLNLSRDFASAAQESKPPAKSERVSAIVDELSGLTLLEVADLTELLRKKLNIDEMPVMAVMMPGMGFGGGVKGKSREAAAKGEEKKVEKTAFDLKLEGGFDAGAKIKIIKEVRTFTNLGLKEAKDLVEKAPTLLKKGVTKEEAEKIIEKMKEIGAKVIMD